MKRHLAATLSLVSLAVLQLACSAMVHADEIKTPCELVYPGAPNVRHARLNDFIKAHLRPELK